MASRDSAQIRLRIAYVNRRRQSSWLGQWRVFGKKHRKNNVLIRWEPLMTTGSLQWNAQKCLRSPGPDRGRSRAGEGAAQGGGCPFPMPPGSNGVDGDGALSYGEAMADRNRVVHVAREEQAPASTCASLHKTGNATIGRQPIGPGTADSACGERARSGRRAPMRNGVAAHIFGETGTTAAMDVVNREIGLCSRSRRRSDGSRR